MNSAVGSTAEHRAIIALGSNIGDPPRQLEGALAALARVATPVALSGVYRTSPVGFLDQPDFLNMVVAVTTDLGAESLLAELRAIEAGAGRQREMTDGPRTLDLDILDHDGSSVRTPGLELPHPRMHLRRFVLAPLVEILPGWRHPTLLRTARDLLAHLDSDEEVRRVGSLEELLVRGASDPPPGRDGGGAAATLVEVSLGAAGSYPVQVGAGLLDRLPDLLTEHAPAHRYALISDANVAAHYGGALLERLTANGRRADLYSFPSGEEHKTRESWSRLTDSLLHDGHGRDSAVLALGGGVTGDLAGFVAATYMRGIPLVQLPTSLLAMVDSSVGGKTGVDTPAGKNLVGAFHPPALVVADTGTLETLPTAELRAGAAEAVKHGAIADAAYLDWLCRNAAAAAEGDAGMLSRLVVRSVEIKAGVVGRDERETGVRKSLNFGHTIGHALEALSRYTLLHGEAIAIGMVVEARLGEALGVTEAGTSDRLRRALAAFALPTAVPRALGPGAILELTRLDKKARAGAVEYALIERIGRAKWGIRVEDDAVLEALAACSA